MSAAESQSWTVHAACRYAPPDLFFGPYTWPQIERAVGHCRRCPVRAECIAEADSWPVHAKEGSGIRGGKAWNRTARAWTDPQPAGRPRKEPRT